MTCWSGKELMSAMQNVIKLDLNPLFKIHELILTDALPRTASNKVMRRALRDQWYQNYWVDAEADGFEGTPALLSSTTA